MSAFYTAKYANRIEVLTDGARYLDDGRITEITSKVWQIGTLPMVFTGRGKTSSVEMVKACLNMVSFGNTFDRSIACFREMLETQRNKTVGSIPIDGVIAGISETQGPVIYYFHTYSEEDGEFEGMDSFVLHEVDREFAGCQTPDPRTMRDSGLPMYWAIDDTAEYGALFFEALRRTPMIHIAHPDKPKLYGVGGHVDHTVITVKGVMSSCIHRWPDEIGSVITP